MPEPLYYESRHKSRSEPASPSDITGWIIAGVFLLWLLAAVCLAWPVTSLLVRRRRGRGFEVEAKGGGAVSTADS